LDPVVVRFFEAERVDLITTVLPKEFMEVDSLRNTVIFSITEVVVILLIVQIILAFFFLIVFVIITILFIVDVYEFLLLWLFDNGLFLYHDLFDCWLWLYLSNDWLWHNYFFDYFRFWFRKVEIIIAVIAIQIIVIIRCIITIISIATLLRQLAIGPGMLEVLVVEIIVLLIMQFVYQGILA